MYTVVIDPGHGDRDVGAIGKNGLLERDVCLEVAKRVKKYLQQHSVTVVLTRNTNHPGFPELRTSNLQYRCDIASRAKADLFISIHCDSFTDRKANGTTTFCFRKNSLAGKLAKLIQRNLVETLKTHDRGVKEANFYVLRKTQMPAVLVELAFISNPQEEQKLGTAEFQDKCAKAITRGVLQMLSIPEKTEPSGWAKEAWDWGKANKLTDGTRPRDNMTREEMIAVLHTYHYRRSEIK